MKVTRGQLQRIINEELQKQKSEMREFAEARGGRRVQAAGKKIQAAADSIATEAIDQTGHMGRALNNIAEFTMKLGETLSSLGMVQEGDSVTSKMPTVQELKQIIKEIQKLEK